ncbi:hypothetical protein CHLNCDRAFT_140218 [Chlorella variabilis]|uniref:UBP34/UBP24/USP9X/USP9Y-like ARM repeat region domain-containing protein n=1 Tax=Chlorella variabilis TaxID=554065 RepID=E1ZRT6_CHLVA|nr:hypothetical protein CHLNCDRAFT_140218 [Chlorella variabilis]EFN51469.1 hypothetical protein CHLNCDRAFT_140218 [Chlorella variabilis]|eukprot:XP_005843571.1 hypothetical protein CHLNCDRAFT_140218 [Chlorella variabilis]
MRTSCTYNNGERVSGGNSPQQYPYRNRVDETDDTVFLMYTSFFQPLMREALGPAMHQMLDEERQMQLVGLHNAEDYRAACQQFIHFVASFLTLHVSVLQGRELQPTISQRGLTAASDLSAVEDTAANPEQRVAKVLMLVRQLLAAAASSEEAEAEVGPLQREHVLRLLHAPAFTRQLAGIKQLRDLAAFTFYQSRLGSEAFMAWLQQHGIVQLVLKSNLHQAQYADQMARHLRR